MRSIQASGNITLAQASDNLTIGVNLTNYATTSALSAKQNTLTANGNDTTTYKLLNGTTVRSIQAGGNITIAQASDNLTINTTGLAPLAGATFTGTVVAPAITLNGSDLATQLSRRTQAFDVPAMGDWFLFGRISTAQGGRRIFIRLNAGTGFNAVNTDHNSYQLLFNTSNGSDSQTGTGGGNFYASAVSFQTGPKTNGPFTCRIVQESTTQYAFYFLFGPFSGEVPAEFSGEPFTYIGTSTTTAPTGTYLDVPLYLILTTQNMRSQLDSIYTVKSWNCGYVAAAGTTVASQLGLYTNATVSKSQTGYYNITFGAGLPSINYNVFATLQGFVGMINVAIQNTSFIQIRTYNATGVATDANFSYQVIAQ
jgi:hypothetical protein